MPFALYFRKIIKKSKEYQRFWDAGSVFSGHVETKILKFSPASATKVRLPGRGGREGRGREGKGREGKGREGKGREGKGREGKGREGRKGREGKGREGKGREGKGGRKEEGEGRGEKEGEKGWGVSIWAPPLQNVLLWPCYMNKISVCLPILDPRPLSTKTLTICISREVFLTA